MPNCNRPSLDLPIRTAKPRQSGLTCLVDNGIGLREIDDKLQAHGEFVDVIKLGWASAYLTPQLQKKIRLFREYGIETCLGGMMFEICHLQNKIDSYIAWLNDLNLKLVEISNGSLPIPESEKVRMIEMFSSKGFTVLSEVGSKDINENIPPETWVSCIKDDQAAGAWKVITEGRADASAGIYNADGSPKMDIIDHIIDSGLNLDDLIFEAPHKRQMCHFIKAVGENVNLGNIPPSEILNLETLRLGLRGDTVQHFHLPANPLDGTD